MAADGNRWVTACGPVEVERVAVLGDQAGGGRAGRREADLLAEHRLQRHLVAVEVARDPQPGRR